jgi:hypothetical protein
MNKWMQSLLFSLASGITTSAISVVCDYSHPIARGMVAMGGSFCGIAILTVIGIIEWSTK